MSLRRLITTVTALAVTAVVAAMGIIGYMAMQSTMRTELDSKLSATVAAFLRPGRGTAVSPAALRSPAPPPFGGSPVYLQLITRDGTVVPLRGQAPSPPLPVDARARHVAVTGSGRYFTDMTVDGVHVRVLTAGNGSHPWAVQAARPLTGFDSVLHAMRLIFAVLVGAGVVLAVILGELVGRTALAPISRFSTSTEQVTGVLDGSERLAEAGPTELARLASSFNRTLQALERSVRAQRHLVADASHELRTPIAALRSNVQVYLDSGRLPAGEAEALRAAIVAELDDLTQLVANVVDLARDASPTARDEPLELIELDQIVADAIERTRRRAAHLRFDVSLEPTVIRNMPDRVGRAVANVLDNARKWSPPGGSVEIRLAGGTLSVRDQGPGFAEKDVPYVFDRFYRAEQARRLPGSGLGLAIVQQAATARGGQVQASNAPQGGALVRLTFGPQPAPNHP